MENVDDISRCKELYQTKSPDDLILQQIGLRASIHCMQYIIDNKGGRITPEAMLHSLKEQLFLLHEVANARGLHLVSYT